MDDYLIGVLSNIGVISFVALSAYLLLLTGEISFGQQAFFAIGAYAAGIATALWGWPLAAALVWGAATGGGAALLVGIPTLRLHGLYFAIATLAFAEMVRILFELFRYQISIDGELVGPNGADGFRNIRYIFDNNIDAFQFMLLIYALLAAALLGFMLLERSRIGVIFRMIGEDETLAGLQGVSVARHKVLAAGIAGALAGIGGGLYAHLTTYVEPRIFDVMLGVHSLAYGLIGGLGTALGPLLGVLIDIGLLESIRVLAGYRMIIFGGLVALLLIVRPRGLLDEQAGAQDRPRLAETIPAAQATVAFEAARQRQNELEDGNEVRNLRPGDDCFTWHSAIRTPDMRKYMQRPTSVVSLAPSGCNMTASSSSPTPAPMSRCPASR